MTDQPTASERCPNCGARWSRSGDQWLVTDIHGRLSMVPGSRMPLTSCPVCKAPGTHEVGGRAERATVTEEQG